MPAPSIGRPPDRTSRRRPVFQDCCGHPRRPYAVPVHAAKWPKRPAGRARWSKSAVHTWLLGLKRAAGVHIISRGCSAPDNHFPARSTRPCVLIRAQRAHWCWACLARGPSLADNPRPNLNQCPDQGCRPKPIVADPSKRRPVRLPLTECPPPRWSPSRGLERSLNAFKAGALQTKTSWESVEDRGQAGHDRAAELVGNCADLVRQRRGPALIRLR